MDLRVLPGTPIPSRTAVSNRYAAAAAAFDLLDHLCDIAAHSCGYFAAHALRDFCVMPSDLHAQPLDWKFQLAVWHPTLLQDCWTCNRNRAVKHVPVESHAWGDYFGAGLIDR